MRIPGFLREIKGLNRNIKVYLITICLANLGFGVMACGYFIIQLPFLSHYAGENKNLPFTFTNLIFFSATSLGALLGGFLPHWISPLNLDSTMSFRLALAGSSLLVIAGTLPLFFLNKDQPADTTRISLSPYLKGIDGTTVKFAAVELFIGFGLAFLVFFMNLFFIYRYRSNIESFGVMNLILIVPLIFFLLIGPALAKQFKNLRVILAARLLSIFLAVIVGLTTNAIIGGSAYIFFRTFISLSQTLWFAFAASAATRRSRMATSTWLEITFQIGLGIAALVGGKLIASDSYFTLGVLSAISMAVSFILTYIFFGRKEKLTEITSSTLN